MTVPEANDEIAIVDASAATTKKITRNDFLKGAALPADTVTTAAIADGAVTADKIDFTTFNKPKTIEILLNSSTGTQTITGVGFKASHATTFSQGSAGVVYFGSGVATQDGASVINKGAAIRSEGSSGNQTFSDVCAFLHVTAGGSGLLRGVITGFTDDGFTINIPTMGTTSVGPRTWVVTLYP